MSDTVCWVRSDARLDGILTPETQAQICREDGSLHRLYQALTSCPSIMLPAHNFYQAVLHSPDCPLDLHTAEFVATYVAVMNECTYARAHHGANFCNTAPSRADAERALAALEADDLDSAALSPRFRALAVYTRKLTKTPEAMNEADIHALRAADLSDAEIVHLNQIAASFAYWIRMINGLGISLGEETVGLAATTLGKIMNESDATPSET